MEPARRLMSSRASARPLSTAVSRPFTGMNSSSTGLMPPKSSRATASVRRQIQDKSYYQALINAKMNELNQEIGKLTRATEQMKNNESRVNLMQQAASSLANQLKEKSSLLSAYSEYFERMKFDDSISDVEKEIELAKEDNEMLIAELENKYKDKKEAERALNNLETDFKQIQANFSNLILKLDAEQQQRFRELDQTNKQLNFDCEQLEKQIAQLKQRVNQLEESSSDSETSSIFRKEVLHCLERLRALEDQHDELFGEQENQKEDERSRLLAQVKRDNRTINQLEHDRTNLETELNKLRSLDEEYNDENLTKYNEYNSQERTINEFLIEFNNKRTEQLKQIKELTTRIREQMETSSRIRTQISILKDSTDQTQSTNQLLSDDQHLNESATFNDQSNTDKMQLILNEKRKLTLDLAKIEQLKEKVTDELSTLKSQIEKLTIDTEYYNNVQQMKDQARVKLDKLNELKTKLNIRLEESSKEESLKKQQFDKMRNEFGKENSIYKKISKYEQRLADLEQRAKALYDEIEEYDHEHLKVKAFQEISKYNDLLKFSELF